MILKRNWHNEIKNWSRTFLELGNDILDIFSGNLAENIFYSFHLSLLHICMFCSSFDLHRLLESFLKIKAMQFAFTRRTFYSLFSEIYAKWSFYYFQDYLLLFLCYSYVLRNMITRKHACIEVSLICAGMFCCWYNRHGKKWKCNIACLCWLCIQHDRHANFVNALMCCLRWWWEKCHDGWQ